MDKECWESFVYEKSEEYLKIYDKIGELADEICKFCWKCETENDWLPEKTKILMNDLRYQTDAICDSAFELKEHFAWD